MAQAGYRIVSAPSVVYPQMVQVGENTVTLPIENNSNLEINRLSPVSYEIVRERAITLMDLIQDVFPSPPFYEDYYNKYFKVIETGLIDINTGALQPSSTGNLFFSTRPYYGTNTYYPVYNGYCEPVADLSAELEWGHNSMLYIQHRYSYNHISSFYLKYQILDSPSEVSNEYYLLKVFSPANLKKNWVGHVNDFDLPHLPNMSVVTYDDIINNSGWYLEALGFSGPFDLASGVANFPQLEQAKLFYPHINIFQGKSVAKIYYMNSNNADGSDNMNYFPNNIPCLTYFNKPIFRYSSIRYNGITSGSIKFNQLIQNFTNQQVLNSKFKIGLEDPWSGNIWLSS